MQGASRGRCGGLVSPYRPRRPPVSPDNPDIFYTHTTARASLLRKTAYVRISLIVNTQNAIVNTIARNREHPNGRVQLA